MELLPADWPAVIAPATPLLELLARGSLLYFGLLVLVRFMPRRTGGELARMDLIFVLLIAEAAAHALGDYTSVADGLVVIVTLMFWNWLINILSYRIPAIERLVSAPPMQLIRHGRLLRRNMRSEYLTEEELMTHLHREGIETFEKVKAAYIEGDGRVTVIPAE